MGPVVLPVARSYTVPVTNTGSKHAPPDWPTTASQTRPESQPVRATGSQLLLFFPLHAARRAAAMSRGRTFGDIGALQFTRGWRRDGSPRTSAACGRSRVPA